MIRLDSQTAKELIVKFRSILNEKSLQLASSVRRRVNAAFDPQLAANGAAVNNKLINAREWYEEFTGIDEVRRAQEKVVLSESKFVTAQEARRQSSKKLADIQSKLRDVYGELEKTRRGEDRYIFLVTQEHALMKEEELLSTNFQQYEQEERENFSMLSSAVKESHEKERLQAERTKYWSIIASVVGTIIGVMGTSINNRYKMNEFRSILTQAVTNEQKLDLLVSDKIAERLETELKNVVAASTVATTTNNNSTPVKVGSELSKKELESFYNGIVASLAQQEKSRREREGVLFGAALSAGVAFVLYRLLF